MKYVIAAIVGLYVINLLLPVALWLLGIVVTFWSRGRIEPRWAPTLQKLKWGKYTDSALPEGPWFFFDVIICGAVTGAIVIALSKWGISGGVFLASIVALIFLPRYLFDFANSIKYSWSERKAERLDKLEAEVARLKGKA
ncbi:MAG: hypothetical protein AAF542_17765 [Pseudomonadota bacterium]